VGVGPIGRLSCFGLMIAGRRGDSVGIGGFLLGGE
jgi:hypothetical protein